MDSSSNTPLFDADVWRGKTFDGRWHASPHAADVIEPATGNTLGRIGLADGAAIADASAAAPAHLDIRIRMPDHHLVSATFPRGAQTSTADLYALVRPLLRDPARRATLGRAGRDAVRADFTEDRMCQRMLEFYRGVLAQSLSRV